MPKWFLSGEKATSWANGVFAQLGNRPRDLVAAIGGPAELAWETEDDEWPAWYGMAQFLDRGRTVSLSVGMDYAAFDEDDEPLPGRFVVELAAVIGLDRGQQLPAALSRSTAAWKRCAWHRQWATEPLPYPNRAEAAGSVIALFDFKAIETFDPAGVWVVCRSAPFSLVDGNDVPAATAAAVQTMLPLMDGWLSATLLTRGAIFGSVPSLDVATIIGWCGEALLWYSQGIGGRLNWSYAWNAPFDFTDGEGRYVEVKTTDEGASELHFSPDEVALGLRSRGRYVLAHVRIDTSIARGIIEALNGPAVHEDPDEDAWGPEGARLASAIGRDTDYVRERWPPIRDILFNLEPRSVTWETDPFGWLAPVAEAALARRVGLVLPVGASP